MAPSGPVLLMGAAVSATRLTRAGRPPAGISRAEYEKSGLFLRDPGKQVQNWLGKPTEQPPKMSPVTGHRLKWSPLSPDMQDWWQRVQALPSFQASITHKTTDEDATAMKTSGGRIRERVRERRDEYRRMPKAVA